MVEGDGSLTRCQTRLDAIPPLINYTASVCFAFGPGATARHENAISVEKNLNKL